jgi:predicted dithiol-disulfide oxidoreductase (DUF899 family)
MTLPEIVDRSEWLVARKALLAREKELTRARDALSADRRRLPMVRVEKDYVFTGPQGKATLLDLFEGRDQLILTHFMFDPAWDQGCPSCTAGADEVSRGLLEHLHTRGTTLAFCSRAPIEKIERYKAERGWEFPWWSSYGSDFNLDFHVTLDPAQAPVMYNYRSAEEWEALGAPLSVTPGSPQEQPGDSVFLRVGDEVFHSYSDFGRGTEWTGGSYAFLDLTPLGRQEEWEEPKGRAALVRADRPDFTS